MRRFCAKSRIERDVEQAALAAREHLRHAADRRRQLAVRVDDAQPARPLGDQHAPVGQERQRPRLLKPARDGLDRKLARGRLEGLRACLRR